jgi:hypothetical protein
LLNPIIGIDRIKGCNRGLLALNSIEKAKISKEDPRKNQETTGKEQSKNKVKSR